jgi:hypothetical protein
MKFFVKMKGERGPIYLERVCVDGDPVGYRRMVGAELLNNAEQQAVYARLPERFTFAEAAALYGKTDDPTHKFLMKCISVGILEQPTRRGPYCKLVPVERIEEVEQELREVPAPSLP